MDIHIIPMSLIIVQELMRTNKEIRLPSLSKRANVGFVEQICYVAKAKPKVALLLKGMVRRFQLLRLGVAFMNVEHFAFYRKLNGGRKPEIFNRMYRIPEKRLDGSPSMVVTSDVRKSHMMCFTLR